MGWKERYYAEKFEVGTEDDRERIRRDVVRLHLNCSHSLKPLDITILTLDLMVLNYCALHPLALRTDKLLDCLYLLFEGYELIPLLRLYRC